MTVEDLNTQPATPADTPPPESAPSGSFPDQAQSEDDILGAIWDKAQTDRVDMDDQSDAPDGDERKDGARERDPDTGRFVAKDKGEGDETGQEQEKPEASLEGEEQAGEQPGSSTAGDAPAHFPQALKAQWSKIPQEAQKAITDLATDFDRKATEYGKQMNGIKPIQDALSKVMESSPVLHGMSVDQIAHSAASLAAIQAKLAEPNPQTRVQTIMQVAQTYGVLPHLAKALSGGQGGDQTILALQQQVANLTRQLEQPQNQFSPEKIDEMISQKMEQSASKTEAESLLDQMAAENTELWSMVEDSMETFIGLARQQKPDATRKEQLAHAFDMAVNADPEARKKLREQEAAKATTSDADTKRKAAAEKAASINVKSNSNGKTRELTERESLGLAYDRAVGA